MLHEPLMFTNVKIIFVKCKKDYVKCENMSLNVNKCYNCEIFHRDKCEIIGVIHLHV